MVPSSDGSEAIDGWNAHARGGVGIGRATGPDIGGRKSDPTGQGLHVVSEPTRALELLHRLPARHLRDFNGDIGHPGLGCNGMNGRDGLLELGTRDAAHIDLEVRQIGHDVRPGPGLKDPDIRGDAGPSTVQRLDALDHPRPGMNRVPTLLRLHPGMGGSAANRETKVRDALPGRHEIAICPGALKDEAQIG